VQAAHLTMPLEKHFGKRLQRASAQGDNDAEIPTQKRGRPTGKDQGSCHPKDRHQFISCDALQSGGWNQLRFIRHPGLKAQFTKYASTLCGTRYLCFESSDIACHCWLPASKSFSHRAKYGSTQAVSLWLRPPIADTQVNSIQLA